MTSILRKILRPVKVYYGLLWLPRGAPCVLANSLPKSGTHLLLRCLQLMRLLPYSTRGRTHPGIRQIQNGALLDGPDPTEEQDGRPALSPDALAKIDGILAGCQPGRYLISHLPHDPRLVELCRKYQLKTLLILRDPRDVALSHMYFVQKRKAHFLHAHYFENLSGDSERLLASIRGVPAGVTESGRGIRSVGGRLARMMPWLGEEINLTIRFEDLIGPAGGGSEEDQIDCLENIAVHLNLRLSRVRLAGIARQLFSRTSPTFRKGAIGDWRDHFLPEHKEAFKQVAGRYLIDLGYERDFDW